MTFLENFLKSSGRGNWLQLEISISSTQLQRISSMDRLSIIGSGSSSSTTGATYGSGGCGGFSSDLSTQFWNSTYIAKPTTKKIARQHIILFINRTLFSFIFSLSLQSFLSCSSQSATSSSSSCSSSFCISTLTFEASTDCSPKFLKSGYYCY